MVYVLVGVTLNLNAFILDWTLIGVPVENFKSQNPKWFNDPEWFGKFSVDSLGFRIIQDFVSPGFWLFRIFAFKILTFRVLRFSGFWLSGIFVFPGLWFFRCFGFWFCFAIVICDFDQYEILAFGNLALSILVFWGFGFSEFWLTEFWVFGILVCRDFGFLEINLFEILTNTRFFDFRYLGF